MCPNERPRVFAVGSIGHDGGYLAKRLLDREDDVSSGLRDETDAPALKAWLPRLSVPVVDLEGTSGAEDVFASMVPEIQLPIAWK